MGCDAAQPVPAARAGVQATAAQRRRRNEPVTTMPCRPTHQTSGHSIMSEVTRRGLQRWLSRGMDRLRSGRPADDMKYASPAFEGLHHPGVGCTMHLEWAAGSKYGQRLVEVKLSALPGSLFGPSRVSVKVAAVPQFGLSIWPFDFPEPEEQEEHPLCVIFGAHPDMFMFERKFTTPTPWLLEIVYRRISETQHIRNCSVCDRLYSGGSSTCPQCVLSIDSEDSSDEGEDTADLTGAGVCLVCQGDLPRVVECGACSARLHQRCFQQLVQRTRGSRRCPQCRAADMTAGVGSRKRKRD